MKSPPSPLAAPRLTPHAGVTSLTAIPIAIPYRRPLRLASGVATEHCSVLVEIGDGDALSGWGEIAPGPGTSRATVVAIAERIAALRDWDRALAGDSGDARAVPIPPELRPCIEAASLDLQSRYCGVPLHRMLDDRQAAPRVAVNAMIDRAPPEVVRLAIDDAVASGFQCLKIKLDPGRFASCAAALRYVREVHGDNIGLRVDCNGEWGRDDALRAMRALEPFSLDYVEQPVAALEDLAALRGSTSVRIAADESARDLGHIERIVEIGAADILILKPARLGPLDSLRAATAAAGAGIACVVSSHLETSLGIAAALHVAAVVDEIQAPHRLAHGLGTIGLLDGDIAEPGLRPDGGFLDVPRRAGCGVTPLAELVARYQITSC